MRCRIVPIFVMLLGSLVPAFAIQAQRENSTLQLGASFSRTVARGQNHRFEAPLDSEQFMQFVVDQRGVDLIIRTFAPDGKPLGEFDSPNGNSGPEVVPLVSMAAGVYSIQVTPLAVNEDVSGRFDLRVTDLRRATEPELRAGKSREALKTKGVALMSEVAALLQSIRSAQSRVNTNIQAAQFLRTVDDRLARSMLEDAASVVREHIEKLSTPNADVDVLQLYSNAQQMRQAVLNALSQVDADAALAFLRSTRSLPNPDVNLNSPDPEVRLEMSIANQIAAKDPRRAAQITEETLGRGYSTYASNVISAVRNSDPVLAARLMGQTVARLQNEKLLSTPEAANVAVNLLRIANSPATRFVPSGGTAPLANVPLLSQIDYRNLFNKVLEEALAYSPDSANLYTSEANAARNLLNSLKTMSEEVGKVSPASVKAIEDKLSQMNTPNARDRTIQDALNTGRIDVALATAAQAPADQRDNLYMQIAQRVASSGDIVRGKQIANDFIFSFRQRQQALDNINRQAMQNAVSKGQVEEALRGLSLLRTPRDRANMITQIVNWANNSNVKKDRAASILNQLRPMLSNSPRAENNEQLNALIQMAGALSRFDASSGFEIVEPLIDQFNDMSVAAVVLNGFGQEYYIDGEMPMQNYTPLTQIATGLGQAFGRLALADFDRARSDVERIRRPEARITAFIAMAQQMINPQPLGR